MHQTYPIYELIDYTSIELKCLVITMVKLINVWLINNNHVTTW